MQQCWTTSYIQIRLSNCAPSSSTADYIKGTENLIADADALSQSTVNQLSVLLGEENVPQIRRLVCRAAAPGKDEDGESPRLLQIDSTRVERGNVEENCNPAGKVKVLIQRRVKISPRAGDRSRGTSLECRLIPSFHVAVP